MLKNHPGWKERIAIEPDGADTALTKVKDGELDLFFVMDAPASPLLTNVRQDVDQKTGKPFYKFVDIRPDSKTLGMKTSKGEAIYATAIVAPGIFSSTKTIATREEIVVSIDLYKANPEVAKIIRQANEDSRTEIANLAGARPDWAADFGE